MHRESISNLLFQASRKFMADKVFRYNLLGLAKQEHIPKHHLQRLLTRLHEQTAEPSESELAQIASFFPRRHWLALMKLLTNVMASPSMR